MLPCIIWRITLKWTMHSNYSAHTPPLVPTCHHTGSQKLGKQSPCSASTSDSAQAQEDLGPPQLCQGSCLLGAHRKTMKIFHFSCFCSLPAPFQLSLNLQSWVCKLSFTISVLSSEFWEYRWLRLWGPQLISLTVLVAHLWFSPESGIVSRVPQGEVASFGKRLQHLILSTLS